jgi:enoyl-CoA hydratase/carnithine racemase
MAYTQILLEKKGHRADVIINRPEKRNALSGTVISELVDAFEDCKRDDHIRVVVFSGAGDKAFCAGADLAEQQKDANEYERFKGRDTFIYLFEIIGQLGKPVVAQVQGLALAGGLGLVAACDFVIASEVARFGTPEINVGMFPMMISALLIRNIGRKKLIDLMFTGRQMDAHEAEGCGLVTRVVPLAKLVAEVDALADSLASKSPSIMKLGKDALYNMQDMTLEQSLKYLAAMLSLCLVTDDSKEGLTAFVEKRKPEWTGR